MILSFIQFEQIPLQACLRLMSNLCLKLGNKKVDQTESYGGEGMSEGPLKKIY